MKSSKQIFLLYSCNEWKSNNSLRLICATTSSNKLKKAIAKQVDSGNMAYSNGEELSTSKQIALLKDDWGIRTRAIINHRLNYGFFTYVKDGDII